MEELNSDSSQAEHHDDQEEDIIPPEEASNLEDITTIYDEFDSRDKELDQMGFNSILDHKFKNGILIFKTRYVGDIDEAIVEIPFGILKKDEPVIVPRYIKEHVVEDKRQGHYNTWSKKTLKYHTRTIRRLHRLFEMDLKLTKMEQLKSGKLTKPRVKINLALKYLGASKKH